MDDGGAGWMGEGATSWCMYFSVFLLLHVRACIPMCACACGCCIEEDCWKAGLVGGKKGIYVRLPSVECRGPRRVGVDVQLLSMKAGRGDGEWRMEEEVYSGREDRLSIYRVYYYVY